MYSMIEHELPTCLVMWVTKHIICAYCVDKTVVLDIKRVFLAGLLLLANTIATVQTNGYLQWDSPHFLLRHICS